MVNTVSILENIDFNSLALFDEFQDLKEKMEQKRNEKIKLFKIFSK